MTQEQAAQLIDLIRSAGLRLMIIQWAITFIAVLYTLRGPRK